MKKSPQPLYNLARGDILAQTLYLADNYWLRLRGLMGRPPLADDEALWIEPCQQVHTCFMPVPLDLVFLDREGVVLRVVRGLRPWRISPWVRGARCVLEFTARDRLPVDAGDRLGPARETSGP